MILALEAVYGIAVAWLFLAQIPTLRMFSGGVLILGASVLISRSGLHKCLTDCANVRRIWRVYCRYLGQVNKTFPHGNRWVVHALPEPAGVLRNARR